jgi:hypothetical protein
LQQIGIWETNFKLFGKAKLGNERVEVWLSLNLELEVWEFWDLIVYKVELQRSDFRNLKVTSTKTIKEPYLLHWFFCDPSYVSIENIQVLKPLEFKLLKINYFETMENKLIVQCNPMGITIWWMCEWKCELVNKS